MSTDDAPGPSVEDLVAELDRDRPVDTATFSEAPGEAMFAAGKTAPLFELAVAVCSDAPGPHGSGLVDLMESVVGTTASPGTIYPVLHDLRDEGVLAEQQLVRTKHYSIADPEAADAILADYEQRLAWWLALARTAREALDTETDTDADADTGTDPDADA